MNLGRCNVVHDNRDGTRSFVYLSPRKRRRTQRKDLRRLTEATARAWGVHVPSHEFTKPLCKRLLSVMSGTEPADLRACFWYDPADGGAFRSVEDPGGRAIVWHLEGDDLISAGLTAVFCNRPMRADVVYLCRRWALNTPSGIRVTAWLFLPEGAPERNYHQVDMHRVMDHLYRQAVTWCTYTGLRTSATGRNIAFYSPLR